MVSFIAERDLLALAGQSVRLRRVASTNGGEWAGPCPFCGEGTDRFRVWPNLDGGRWWCRVCDRSGDSIAYLVERGDITPQEAGKIRREAEGTPATSGPRPRHDTAPAPPPAPVKYTVTPPPEAWREQARAFVGYCQGLLFTDAGKVGLDWLHGRGLTDDTIKAWGLGWHEKDRWRDPEKWGLDAGEKKIYLAAGVVIPWTVEGDPWHVKTRRLAGDDGPKYIGIRGGTPTLYGLDHLQGRRVVVICEGELDAPLLWQVAGDLVDVVAIGSKGAKIPAHALPILAGAARWLVALDVDADADAAKWGAWSARVRRARPLHGNDLTDFHQAGGDLRQWVTYHLEQIDAETKQPTKPLPMPSPSPNGWEAKAEALLAQAEGADPVAWRRSWAVLAQAQGWPCWGTTWAEWANAQ